MWAPVGQRRRAVLVVAAPDCAEAARRAIEQAAPGAPYVLVGPDADAGDLTGIDYDRVAAYGLDDGEALSDALIRDAFSRRLRWLRRLSDGGALAPYRPWRALAGVRPRVLVLFPGSPIPLDKGSNQRAFNLVWHLNRAGIATDLLLTTASRRSLPRLAELLSAIAPRVFTYRNDKPMLPPRQRARRTVERAYRLAGGAWRKPPDLFAERLATRGARDGRRQLGRLVAGGDYDAVIVSFAWMTGLVDAVRPRVSAAVRWLCDTHDVQFARGETLNRGQRRLGVSAARERDAELAALRAYDRVIAISPSDADELARNLGDDRVLLAPTGFDYAVQPLPEAAARPPFRFGFIGRAMDANAAALSLLAHDWWPAIERAAPGSRLLVAGTLCGRADVRALVAGRTGIELLGFLPTLADFYRRIDIALNPVVVQGGLNFKSIEALAAGRLLVTTPMGARCLGEGAPVAVAETGAEAARLVRAFADEPERLHEERGRAQTWCREQFSEQRAYAALRSYLRGP